MALLRAAQAQALLNGRHGVIPEDLQAVFVAVVAHRVQMRGNIGSPRNSTSSLAVLTDLLANTPVP
jgi:MoxR-like ATPase